MRPGEVLRLELMMLYAMGRCVGLVVGKCHHNGISRLKHVQLPA